MKTADNADRWKMLGLLSPEENNLVLYDALRDKDLTKFFYLLKRGYGLTPFILNVMIDFGYEQNMVKALKVCQVYSFSVYDFLCAYWGQKKAEDFLVENGCTKVIEKMFSVPSLVKYKFWSLLVEKKEYEALIRAEKFDLIEEVYDRNPSDRLQIVNTLVKVGAESGCCPKIIDVLAEFHEFSALNQVPNGCFKLLELEKWEFIPLDSPYLLKKKSYKEVLQLIYEAGGEKYIYDQCMNGKSIFSDFLFDNKYYTWFVKNKNWSRLAGNEVYELIDWDDYYNQLVRSKYFILHAVKACRWDVLAKYKFRWVLLKNFKLDWFFRSF